MVAQQRDFGQQESPEEPSTTRFERIVSDLSLGETQVTALAGLNLRCIKANADLRNQSSQERELVQSKTTEVTEQHDAELKALLPDEQLKKHHNMQNEHHEKMMNRHDGGNQNQRVQSPRDSTRTPFQTP